MGFWCRDGIAFGNNNEKSSIGNCRKMTEKKNCSKSKEFWLIIDTKILPDETFTQPPPTELWKKTKLMHRTMRDGDDMMAH